MKHNNQTSYIGNTHLHSLNIELFHQLHKSKKVKFLEVVPLDLIAKLITYYWIPENTSHFEKRQLKSW